MTTRMHPLWTLDPNIVFLNHGSFGACPRPVLEEQARLRAELEREPVRFYLRELERRLDGAREVLAAFVGAKPENLAFVTNATMGVNGVLRSLDFAPDDEILFTDHGYNACNNAVRFVADRTGARPVVVELPFPITSPGVVVERVLAAVGPRTKLALLDHVTSPTGLVLPIDELVRELDRRGVDTLVDGAHAPGMLALDLERLGAAYYTGNLHKWVCAPKGAGFLWARADKRDAIRPVVISHGANSPRTDRARFWIEHDWAGTWDPTAYLSVPTALATMGALLPGGWDELRAANRAKALAARRVLAQALGVREPAPKEMIGALASLELPRVDGPFAARERPDALAIDPLQDALFARGIEVPVFPWRRAPDRLLRVSAQAYNEPSDYAMLARALGELLTPGARGS